VSVRITCSTGGACKLKLKLTVVETLRKGKLLALSAKTRKTVTYAAAAATMKAGATVTLKPGRAGKGSAGEGEDAARGAEGDLHAHRREAVARTGSVQVQ
jgi:hypothetical protein